MLIIRFGYARDFYIDQARWAEAAFKRANLQGEYLAALESDLLLEQLIDWFAVSFTGFVGLWVFSG